LEFQTLSQQEFDRFRTLIYQLSGIRVAPTKQILVSNRLRKRLKETGIESFDAYYKFITTPPGKAEVASFLDAITTNETYFFRDLSQFDWLGRNFLDELIQAAAKGTHTRRIRVWSAASSSGEELYTISIVLREHAAELAGWRIELLGTDLSQQVLDAARNACYDERALRLVDAARRQSFFQQDPANPARWQVRQDLRSIPRWRRHNLMNPLVGEEPFDVVFLKNVLIYFDSESKEKVLRNVVAAIRPGGFLVVGPTDSVSKHLGQMTREKPWLYRK
jgi:chemotaxis protein methyltransferase CheR